MTQKIEILFISTPSTDLSCGSLQSKVSLVLFQSLQKSDQHNTLPDTEFPVLLGIPLKIRREWPPQEDIVD